MRVIEEEERDNVEVEGSHDDGFGNSISEGDREVGELSLMK